LKFGIHQNVFWHIRPLSLYPRPCHAVQTPRTGWLVQVKADTIGAKYPAELSERSPMRAKMVGSGEAEHEITGCISDGHLVTQAGLGSIQPGLEDAFPFRERRERIAADIGDANPGGGVLSLDDAGGPPLSAAELQDIVGPGEIRLMNSEQVEQNGGLACLVHDVFKRVRLGGFKRGISPKLDFAALAFVQVVHVYSNGKGKVDQLRCIPSIHDAPIYSDWCGGIPGARSLQLDNLRG
jgi:hypothetical protein